jgi:hypothetical protein
MEWVTQLLERERQGIYYHFAFKWLSELTPRRYEWTAPFHSKTKTSLCAITITFRTSYTRHKSGTRYTLGARYLYFKRNAEKFGVRVIRKVRATGRKIR